MRVSYAAALLLLLTAGCARAKPDTAVSGGRDGCPDTIRAKLESREWQRLLDGYPLVAPLAQQITGQRADVSRAVFVARNTASVPSRTSFRTRPRTRRPTNPPRPSARLRLIVTNQNPLPRAGSGNRTRNSRAVTK